jgi:hypothetical protein
VDRTLKAGSISCPKVTKSLLPGSVLLSAESMPGALMTLEASVPELGSTETSWGRIRKRASVYRTSNPTIA